MFLFFHYHRSCCWSTRVCFGWTHTCAWSRLSQTLQWTQAMTPDLYFTTKQMCLYSRQLVPSSTDSCRRTCVACDSFTCATPLVSCVARALPTTVCCAGYTYVPWIRAALSPHTIYSANGATQTSSVPTPDAIALTSPSSIYCFRTPSALTITGLW